MPGGLCGARTGGVGRGRGPPGGVCGRIGGYEGRGGAGRVEMPPGPPGLARLPVAGGSGAVGRGGTTLSDGRRRDGAGRVGIAGTAEVPGAFGSSILSRMLGGTIRPGGGAIRGAGAGGGAAAMGAAGCTVGGADSGGSSITGAGSGACACATGAGSSTGSSTSIGAASSWGSSSATEPWSSTDGAAGLTVFTKRGGARVGGAGFTGSPFFAASAGFFALLLATGPSANMSPPGSVTPRSRARRSTNCLATTSSMVLDALLSSMPCARFNSARTSWLLVLRSSATL